MIRAGFIGTGGISGAHLKYLQARKDVKIAALCDLNRAQVLKKQKEFGGDVFTDFNEMLKRVRLDAVWLCTPPWVRRTPLLACADRGIPVFCEKPVERSETGGRQIAAELRERKAKVQVGYVFRSMPVIQVLRKIIMDDPIHLIHSFYACDVSLKMSLPKWFYDKAKSGGALIDQATHNLDLLRCLFGEVSEVRGTAKNPVNRKRRGYSIDETLGLILSFRNGIIAVHTHSWVGDRWRNEINLSGEKNLYRLNLNTGRLTSDQAVAAACDLYSGKGKKKKPVKAPFQFQQESRGIYEYQNEVFLKQIISGDWSNNPSDYSDGLKSLHLTLACDRALTRGTVKV
ncbi:MAG: Gfo/Idh/MocA family oxidoreductase [Kiritimatiellia bacterium]|nr:Gfo/Idh/MocA family oxidoreductase [Kiritimatiellia bacterium]